MNILKNRSLWIYLTAGFVLSWALFGPGTAVLTYGIMAGVGIFLFGLWYLGAVIIQYLGDPKTLGGTKFFMKARQGCFGGVMRGGRLEKVWLWGVPGKRLSTTQFGKVIPGEAPQSLLYRLYGYEWIGWYPQCKPLRWVFAWEKVKGTEVVSHEPETVQYHYFTYLYGMKIAGVEDSDLIELTYDLGVQVETTDIVKTWFGTSSDPGDWIRKVRVGVFSRLRDFSGQEGRTFETITKTMTSGATNGSGTPTDLVDSIVAANKPYFADGQMNPGLDDSVGQIIKAVNLLGLTPPPKYVEEQQKIKAAKQDAQAQANANEAIRSKARAEGEAEKERLKGLAEGLDLVANAGNGNGSAMYIARELATTKGTLVLGQVPGANLNINPSNPPNNKP